MFTRANQLTQVQVASIIEAPGTIFVKATGLDANAGTRAAPKLTIAGALALLDAIPAGSDLRAGRAIVVLGLLATEPPVVFERIDGITLIGMGAKIREPAGGRTFINTITSFTRISATVAQANCSGAHGLATGDAVIVQCSAQASGNLINGHAIVTLHNPGGSANNFQFETVCPTAGVAPFTGATGRAYPSSWIFKASRNVIIHGFELFPSTTERMAGITVDYLNAGAAGFFNGDNYLFSNLSLLEGSIGFTRWSAASFSPHGHEMNLIGCAFKPTNFLGLNPTVTGGSFAPARLYLGNTTSLSVLHGSVDLLASGSTLGNGVFRAQVTPQGTVLFAGQHWQEGVPADVLETKRLDHDVPGSAPRIVATRNFYDDGTNPDDTETWNPSAGAFAVVDREPARFVGHVLLPTQVDLIWERPQERLVEVADSPGKAVAYHVRFGAEAVHYDASAAAGSAYPKGAQDDPTGSEADAITILTASGLRRLGISGTYAHDDSGAVPSASFGTFYGERDGATYNIGTTGGFRPGRLERLRVVGTSSPTTVDKTIDFVECVVRPINRLVGGSFLRCIFEGSPGTWSLFGGDGARIDVLDSRGVGSGPIFEFRASTVAATYTFAGWRGPIELRNLTDASQTVVIELTADPTNVVTIAASCTAGLITIRGPGRVVNNAAGATVTVLDLFDETTIADQVWEEPISDHVGVSDAAALYVSDTFELAQAIDDRLPIDPADESNQQAQHAATQAAIAALSSTLATLPEDVWDTDLTAHVGADSVGRALSFVLDILFGNTRIDRTNPAQWVEERLDRATGTTVVARYNLQGMDGTAISDANNPFTAPVSRNAAFMRRVRIVGTP